MSEQTPNDNNQEDDQAQDEQARAGIDFIAAVSDERIKRYFADNWAAMIGEVAGAVAEKINVEAIAVQAAKIFEDRWNEQARQNQTARAAANGGDGDDGAGGGVTANGGGGGGDGGGGLSFLDDIQSGGGSNSQPKPAPIPEDARQAVASAGLRLLADPVDAAERLADVVVKLLDRRKPPAVPRNEYEVISDIAARNPNLVNYFASEDPIAPAEKLGEMLSAGVKSGMRISEGIVKQATGLNKKAPKFVVPEVELVDPPPPTPEPAAPAVAPMGQDPTPKRRRRRLSDVV